MFGIGDDYNVEKTAKKIFGAKKIFHTPYSKNTNTLFKRKMSKTFTTLDSHTEAAAHAKCLRVRPRKTCETGRSQLRVNEWFVSFFID
jgi:hypothetical protein